VVVQRRWIPAFAEITPCAGLSITFGFIGMRLWL